MTFFNMEKCRKDPPIDSLTEEGETPDITAAEDITFTDVQFCYPSREDTNVLKGFNLTIKKGTTVALVGESGAGKSTIIKLIQRFYDATTGSVKIGNTSITNINVKWLRKHIGIVNQEPDLFNATIYKNILMGNPDATKADIEIAAMEANAHEFIKAMPQGYDTIVGEGGAKLSGGQKQRIAIARALVRYPTILLLDEATSALDTESESVFQSSLDHAKDGRTTIIIAHRLSTIKNADSIVAVKDGKVVESGTHDELLKRKGVYFQLVMLQEMADESSVELLEKGLILSMNETEELLEVRMKRSLSQMSFKSLLSEYSCTDHTEKEEEELAQELTRVLSIRKKKKLLKKTKVEKNEGIEEVVEPALLTHILKYNKPEWPLVCIGMICSALIGLVPVSFSIILSEVLETFTLPDDELKEKGDFWALVFLGIGVGICTGYILSRFLFGKAGESLTRRMRMMAFAAILRQDIAYFDDPCHTTGQLTARLAVDATKVKGATSTLLSIMVQLSFTGISVIIISFHCSWKLTLVMIAFLPLLVFGGIIRAKRFKNFAATEGKRLLEASTVAQQAITNIRTVASLGKEMFFIDKFTELLLLPFKDSKKQAHIYGLAFGTSRAMSLFANAATFALGGYLVHTGELEFKSVFKIKIAASFGSMIAGQVLSFAPDYLSAKISAARLLKLLDKKSDIDVNDKSGEKKRMISGNINFDDVYFNYPNRPDVPVLQGLTLNVETGQKVALFGTSGCGKSTSVGLLERFYNPTSGNILIDGKDAHLYNLKWLRSQISIVSQEPTLFDRSIRDNIIYGIDLERREVSQKEVEDAAKAANIHGFISTLPKGYATKVGEKGTLLSAGQKQRIAIARAIIRNPRILVLDEATSALDSENEKIVQDALDNAMENRTAIVIAHRLSTIQNADVIAVIEGGRIVEMGTHQELLSQEGEYHMLTMGQM